MFTRLARGVTPERSPDDAFSSRSTSEHSVSHSEVINRIGTCLQGKDALVRVPLLLVALDLVMIEIHPEDGPTPAPAPTVI